MDFLKNHYEKLVLSVVLLGLAVAAALLPLQVSRVRTFLDETVSGLVTPRPKSFPSIEEWMKTNRMAMQRLDAPARVEITGAHNLFNPVPWKRGSDGTWNKLQRGNEFGPGAVQVTGIRPLKLVITFESASGSAENPRYQFGILDETVPRARKQTRFAPPGVKNDLFMIVGFRPENNPTEFDLQLVGEKGYITVSKDKPYERVVGYVADLAYPPEKQTFLDKRVKDQIKLADEPGETYDIVSIVANEVVISARSTKKRTVKPASTP